MQRTRNDDQWARVSTTWSWRASDGTGVENNSYISSGRVRGVNRGMTDIVTPGFRKARANGGVVNNPMSRFVDTSSGGDTGWRMSRPISSTLRSIGESTSDYVYAFLGAPEHAASPGFPTLASEAATACLAKVASPEVQGMVALAELQKTLSMLRRPLSGLIQYIQMYKKKHRHGSFLKAAESSWLELRYGWRPFLYDMDAILKSLNKVRGDRHTARATRVADWSSSKVPSTVGAGGLSFNIRTQTQRVDSVRAGYLYQIGIDNLDVYGFRWSDIPGTAWDLVPFSFVADWFFNTNDFINAMTPRVGVNPLATWTTTESVVTTAREVLTVLPPNGSFTIERPGSGTHTRKTQSITRVPSLSPPALVLKEGSLSSVLSDLRAVDLFALFTQSVRRRAN